MLELMKQGNQLEFNIESASKLFRNVKEASEIERWLALDLDVNQSLDWINAGFSATEASDWIQSGVVSPEIAVRRSDAGIKPQQVK
jgi:hypothetical protein